MSKKLPEAGVASAETNLLASAEGVAVAANSKLTNAKSAKAYAKKSVKIKAEADRAEGKGEGFEGKLSNDEQSAAKSDGSVKLAMAESSVMSDAEVGAGAADVGGQDASAGGGSAAPAASSGGSGSLPLILGGLAIAGGAGALAGGGGKSKDVVAVTPVFTVAADKTSANEGDTIRFTVSGVGTKSGDAVSYQISGISAEDLASGSLTGSVVLDASGRGFVDISLKADARTEGSETLRFELGSTSSVSVAVADTSVNPVYTLTSDKPNANEGDTVRFKLQGSADAKPGDTVTYQITGIAVEDLASGSLTGSFVLGQDRAAFVDISLAADAKTEALETLVMTVSTGGTTSVAVADTSINPVYTLTSDKPNANEGDTVRFKLQGSADAKPGQTVTYVITGIAAEDLASGSLTGSFVLGQDRAGFVDISLAADAKTEALETLVMTVSTGGTTSVAVADTSINPVYTLTSDKPNANEGDTVRFKLQGSADAKPGQTVTYVITGIAAEDLASGSLTGSFVLGQDRGDFVDIVLSADAKTEALETLVMTVSTGGTTSVAVADTSKDPVVTFTTNTDLLIGERAGSFDNNEYVGRVGSTYSATGSATTFESGDQVDGGGGINTLSLSMDPAGIASGTKVSNMQVLNLNLNAAAVDGSASELYLTQWDRSLQQINIDSNKSDLVLLDQQVIAPVSIVDRSIAAFSSSYTFNYAAGVLDGAANALAFTINNVNGVGGSDINIDDGMEAVSFRVADRVGDQYSSNINLDADDVTSIVVTQGRTGQLFTMNADVFSDEDGGASFVSTSFAGDMDLTSGDLDTVALGVGDDTLVINGRGGEGSSYNLGAGDNLMELYSDLAGSITALGGDDDVYVDGSVQVTGLINVGNGANIVTVVDNVRGQVVAGTGNDTIAANRTESVSKFVLDFNGVEVELDQEITVVVTNGAQVFEVTYTVLEADLELTATALAEKLALELGQDIRSELRNYNSLVNGDDASGVAVFTLFDAAPTLQVSVTAGTATVTPIHRGVINAGNGDNVVGVEYHAGDIVTGTGDDLVNVGEDTAISGVINVGGGDNIIAIGDDHYGSVIAGAGDDFVTVGDDIDNFSITNLGDGDNVLLVDDDGYDATVVAGNGDNRIVIGGSLDVNGEIVVGRTGYFNDSSMTLGDGTNRVDILGRMNNSDVTFGDGDGNVLNVGEDVYAGVPGTIIFGDGDANELNIGGSLIGDAVVFGDGDENVMDVGTGVDGGSITFGDGADNALVIGSAGPDVSYDVEGATLTFGDGGNSVELVNESEFFGSTATFGSGDDSMSVAGGVYADEDNDASVSMGGGDDELLLGTKDDWSGYIEGEGDKTGTVDMGGGDDYLQISSVYGEDTQIKSGGFAVGGSGLDTLRLTAENNSDLIVRTDDQIVDVDYSEVLFTLGQVITVTFERGDDTFEVDYTVVEGDFLQGPEGLAAKVAQSIAAQLNNDDAFDALFTATAVDGVVTIQSDAPLEDFILDSSVGDVDVVQISDAEITSFETIELVALNNNGGDDDMTINADFELIEGTNTVNLISQVERNETLQDEDLNGDYTVFGEDGPTTFVLDEMNGGEAITVSGHEVTATGNSQVSRIFVDIDNDDHVVGDTLSVTINDVTVNYVVTAADLNAATGLLDANKIAASLATAITAAATTAGLSVSLDNGVLTGGPAVPQITLIGQPGVSFDLEVEHTRFEATVIDVLTEADQNSFNIAGKMVDLRVGDVITITVGDDEATYTVTEEDCERLEADAIVAHFKEALELGGDWGLLTSEADATLTVTRVIDLVEEERDGDQTTSELVQAASDTDDGEADVVIAATLADDATDTTMDLTVDGEGDFDLAIIGGEDSGFNDLKLTLGDSHDHTIDTGGIGFQSLTAASQIGLNSSLVIPAGSAFAFYDFEFPNGDIVRVSAAQFAGFYDGAGGSISEDGGLTFQPLPDFFEYAVELFSGPDEFVDSMTTIVGYSGAPGADGVVSTVFTSSDGLEPAGNFGETIAVGDASGVDTTGSNIVLENVLAHTVTSTSNANLTIDQYSTRGDDQPVDEVITVSTGTGDDHLITLAQSALTDGSAINLGTGRNTISLGWGNGVTLSDDTSLDFSSIDYTGGLAVFEMLNNVDAVGDKDLVMPGGVDDVEVLKTQDFNLDGDLTIVGAVNDFTISSTDDFEVDGALIIQNAAGVQITGDLLLQVEDEVEITIGNVGLASITVDAGDDIEVEYARNEGGTFVVGDVLLDSRSDDADFQIEDNGDTSVTVGDVTIIADDDADLEIERNTDLTASVGNVVLTSDDEDADVFIIENTGSNITIGSVSLSNEDAEDASWVQFSENTGTTLAMGPLTMEVRGGVYDADLLIGETDDDDGGNTGSSVTIDGPITISSDDDIDLNVIGNDLTNVSLADGSVITLEACEEGDGAIDIELNRNVNDHNPLGPDPLSDEFIQDYAVTLGDLVMNAGNFTDLDIIGNDDDTYFGEMSVTVGDVDMFTHRYAELDVAENESVTVTIGDMDLRAKTYVNLMIKNNDGRIYENSLVDPTTYEPDYADITIGDIVAVSDGSDGDGVGGYLGIGNNDLAQITVGNVSFTAMAAAGIEIVSNANSVPGSFGEDEASADTEITLGDVSIDGVDLVGVSVGLSYSGRFGAPGELNGGNYNAAIDMGEVSLTVTGEDAEAALTVANNRGDGGKGSVDIDSVDVTSSGDVNFFVYNNTLTGASGADAHDMTVGVVTVSADEDANLAIVDNGQQEYVDAADRILTTIEFGDVTLSAGLDDIGTTDNAQVDIEGNDNIDLETGDVTLSGNNTGLFVNGNFYTDVLLGDVELTSTEETLADVTVNGNRSSDIEMGTVTIDSENDALIQVDGNSMHEGIDVTDTTRTDVTIGSVDVVAGEGAQFFVEANSDTDVTIGMDAETVGERGTITIAAAYIGEYSDDAEGFAVFAGEDTDVVLGDVELTATGSGTASDVDVAIGAENDKGEDSSVDMGDLTVNADGDGYVTIAGEDGNLTVGDIVINVGLDDDADVDDFGSDLLFHVDDMDGNADNSGPNKTQTISLSASSRGGADGNLHVVVNDAVDLSALTISGTNAEVYLTGEIGTDTEDTDDFTLDLSGLDGAFGEDDAIGYDALGQGVSDQTGQDDGTLVLTFDADFGTDNVIVKIGSGDMIYNAAHSSWYVGGDDSHPSNDWGSPWTVDEDGWYSLGDGGDFDPTAMVQTIDLAGSYTWVAGNTLTLDYNNETYTFTVAAGGTTLSDTDVDAFFDETGLTIALGEDDSFTITGTPDGAEFEAISEYSAVIGGSGGIEVTSGTSSIVQEDPAEDNWGQEAKETFTFTGNTVGEIVIGGFNPGEWGEVNPNNDRPTDRLDFSQFDWNGDGTVDDADVADLNDFKIEIVDGDGYFKDVVITYIGDEDVEFGEIRLVGAGEFDNAVELVGDSFVFG